MVKIFAPVLCRVQRLHKELWTCERSVYGYGELTRVARNINGGECGPVQSRHGLDSRRVAQFDSGRQHGVDGSQVGHARARHEFISVLEQLDVVDEKRL